MAYQDWDPEARDVFDGIPEVRHTLEIEALFEYGWLHIRDQAEPPEFRDAIRDAFFDALGIPDFEFPWEEWRIWAGYEDG